MEVKTTYILVLLDKMVIGNYDLNAPFGDIYLRHH